MKKPAPAKRAVRKGVTTPKAVAKKTAGKKTPKKTASEAPAATKGTASKGLSLPRMTTRSMAARQKAGVALASNSASQVAVVASPLAGQLQVPRRATGKRVRFLLPEPSPSPQPEPAPKPSRKRKRDTESEGDEEEEQSKRQRVYNLDFDTAVIGMFVLREVAPVTPVNRTVMEWLMKTEPPTPLALNTLDLSEDEQEEDCQ